MMTFERSYDYDLVRAIVTAPPIYRPAMDDFSPAPELYVVDQSGTVHYVLVRDEGELLGLFAFVPANRICWELHTCLLPVAWGPRAYAAMRGVFAWVFAQTECRRVIGCAPKYNRLALRLAEAAGMKRYGVNERSFLRGGVLHDQICLGISGDQ